MAESDNDGFVRKFRVLMLKETLVLVRDYIYETKK